MATIRKEESLCTVTLHFVDMTRNEPAVTHVIPAGNMVGGVTSLGNDVFVVRHDSHRVEVYDAVTFTLQRCLAVSQLGSYSYGLAVCPRYKCLYASDCNNSSVHRVELSGSNAVMTWSVADGPAGLTVNRAQNLPVVSGGVRKLQEFTTRGTLLQNIQLKLDTGELRHAVDLASGQFVVSCRRTPDAVHLVDVNGAVIRSYGGQERSQMMKMNTVSGLAMDKHGNILVANESNNRLLVLDGSLSSVHEMSVSVDGGLNRPFALWYDKSRGRLYIGEWSGGRAIVIDHLKDFSKPTSQ